MMWTKLIKSDLQSKLPYLQKDLENANIDKTKFNEIIELSNKADSTGNQAVYTQWILKQYLKNNFKGEEDIEKFKTTLSNFTKLKNSKKIQPADINQYETFGDLTEKVEETLNNLGGYTSKREEETTKTTEGIRLLDRDDNLELYLVNMPEAAHKEFRNTQWCVKDLKYFENYAKTDPNFYYVKKNGKPYLLIHKNDIRDVYDDYPSKKILSDVKDILIKNNIYIINSLLLENKIITRKDGELFDEVLQQSIEDGNGYSLLENKIITRKDGELFDEVLQQSIGDGNGHSLLKNKILIREDGELFDEVLQQSIGDGNGYSLLYYKIVTREDGELFDKSVRQAIEDGKSYFLLKNKTLIREDGELFDKSVRQAIEDGNGYSLLDNKIITREDGELFDKSVRQAIEDGKSYFLLYSKIVTREDGELFDKLVRQYIEDGKGYSLLYYKIVTREELNKFKGTQKQSRWIIKK